MKSQASLQRYWISTWQLTSQQLTLQFSRFLTSPESTSSVPIVWVGCCKLFSLTPMHSTKPIFTISNFLIFCDHTGTTDASSSVNSSSQPTVSGQLTGLRPSQLYNFVVSASLNGVTGQETVRNATTRKKVDSRTVNNFSLRPTIVYVFVICSKYCPLVLEHTAWGNPRWSTKMEYKYSFRKSTPYFLMHCSNVSW